MASVIAMSTAITQKYTPALLQELSQLDLSSDMSKGKALKKQMSFITKRLCMGKLTFTHVPAQWAAWEIAHDTSGSPAA